MALENLTPSNRLEAILDGGDVTPSNRKEYFIQKAMSAGGSGLPEYTSADKGKVLTIGEGEGGETVVIVPEQTVTQTEGPVPLTGVDVSGFVAGVSGIMTVDGTEYNVTADALPTGDIGFMAVGAGIAIVLDNGVVTCGMSNPGTHTVSLTSLIPTVEPKWEDTEPFVTLKVVRRLMASSNYTDYAVDKNFEDIRTCFNVDTFKPVYAILPTVTPTMPYYDYATNYIALVWTMPTIAEENLIGDWRILAVDSDIILRCYTQQ